MKHAVGRHRRPKVDHSALALVVTLSVPAGLLLPLIGAHQLRTVLDIRPNGAALLALLGLVAVIATRRHPDDRPLPGPWSDYWTTEGEWGRRHYPHDPEQW